MGKTGMRKCIPMKPQQSDTVVKQAEIQRYYSIYYRDTIV